MDEQIQYSVEAKEAFKQKDITRAKMLLEEGLRKNTEDTEAMNLLGHCEYLLCNFERAKYYWQKSIAIKPKENQAVEHMLKFKNETYENFQKIYKEALRFEDRGDYLKAMALYKSLLEREPQMVGLLLHVGHCHFLNGSIKDAKEYMEKALLMDESNEKALRYLDELSVLQTRKKNPGKKLLMYLLLIALIAGGIYLLSILFDGSSSAKNPPKEPVIETPVEEEPVVEEPETPQEEEPVEEEPTEEDPVEEEPIEEEPVEEPTPSNRVFSDNEIEVFEEGLVDFRAERYDRAAEAFIRVLEVGQIEGYLSEALYYLAVTYDRQEKVEDAKVRYEQYLSRFPSGTYFEEILYTYGLFLYERGEVARAKEILWRIPNEVPNSIYNNTVVWDILNEES